MSDLLTADQLQLAERYQKGLDRIADAIEALNDLGRPLGMKPCALYYAGAPQRLWGQNFASIDLNEKLQRHHLAIIEGRRAA